MVAGVIGSEQPPSARPPARNGVRGGALTLRPALFLLCLCLACQKTAVNSASSDTSPAAGRSKAIEVSGETDGGSGLKSIASGGWNELHLAAAGGQADRVRELLEGAAEVDVRTLIGATPLYVAAGAGQRRVVELLLEAGADRDAPVRGGWTPLHAAADHAAQETVTVLLAAGADPLRRSDSGLCPVDLAAVRGDLTMTVSLLDAAPSLNSGPRQCDSLVRRVAKVGEVEILELLIERGFPIDLSLIHI